MKAFAIESATRHGPRDIPTPAPGAGEVLLRVAVVGICGSDVHYFRSGACGDYVVREPLIPGHEASARVVALGDGVTGLSPGELVAVNPSRSCGGCVRCRAGEAHLCLNGRFLGSASRFPHVQGLMSEFAVVGADQCVRPPDPDTDPRVLAFAEPLSVALHAVSRSGGVLGRRVLITGGRTIGLLIALSARLAGARWIGVSDPSPHAQGLARSLGADAVYDGGAGWIDAARDATDGGPDVVFEAAGVEAAFAGALRVARTGGAIVQVGTLAIRDGSAHLGLIMGRELSIAGSFRFASEFAWAVDYLGRGRLDPRPLLSATRPLAEAEDAFRLALDAERTAKVQVVVS